ncbi:hypothetical protein AB205_0059320 [Aquarana catesbeiana]|uniref:Uncharacterized protein n=1 Tax=Aquarana catesbeiana TaxID=8400 RepID=A0A2G9RHU3_AQUCT|nr:hypothetical protein AB205_0059320 [Aquarana catesbeiana]
MSGSQNECLSLPNDVECMAKSQENFSTEFRICLQDEFSIPSLKMFSFFLLMNCLTDFPTTYQSFHRLDVSIFRIVHFQEVCRCGIWRCWYTFSHFIII